MNHIETRRLLRRESKPKPGLGQGKGKRFSKAEGKRFKREILECYKAGYTLDEATEHLKSLGYKRPDGEELDSRFVSGQVVQINRKRGYRLVHFGRKNREIGKPRTKKVPKPAVVSSDIKKDLDEKNTKLDDVLRVLVKTGVSDEVLGKVARELL